MNALNYNNLGQEGFRRLCHALLREYCGPLYRSLDTGGPDGGRDGSFEGTPRRAPELPGLWLAQFKFHDVDQVGASIARTRFIREVRDELAKWPRRCQAGQRVPDVLLFITNVPFSADPNGGTIDKLESEAGSASAGIGRVIFWGRADLDTEIDAVPEVRVRYRATTTDVMAGLARIESELAARLIEPGVAVANDIDLVTNVLYTEDKLATILLADIGNRRHDAITVRQVALHLPGIGRFQPDAPFTSLDISGYRWAGTAPVAIRGQQFVRLAWLIPDHHGVKAALDCGQPVPGAVEIRFFPEGLFSIAVMLYSIRRLREMAAKNGEVA